MNMQMQLASQLSARKRTQEKNQEKAKTWRVGELTREWEEAELKEDLEIDRKTAADRLEICKNNMQFVHEQKMTAIKAFYDDRHEIENSRRRERDRCWNEEKLLLEQRHGLSQPSNRDTRHDHSQRSNPDTRHRHSHPSGSIESKPRKLLD